MLISDCLKPDQCRGVLFHFCTQIVPQFLKRFLFFYINQYMARFVGIYVLNCKLNLGEIGNQSNDVGKSRR